MSEYKKVIFEYLLTKGKLDDKKRIILDFLNEDVYNTSTADVVSIQTPLIATEPTSATETSATPVKEHTILDMLRQVVKSLKEDAEDISGPSNGVESDPISASETEDFSGPVKDTESDVISADDPTKEESYTSLDSMLKDDNPDTAVIDNKEYPIEKIVNEVLRRMKMTLPGPGSGIGVREAIELIRTYAPVSSGGSTPISTTAPISAVDNNVSLNYDPTYLYLEGGSLSVRVSAIPMSGASTVYGQAPIYVSGTDLIYLKQDEISHTSIADIGSTSHSDIDSHIGDTAIHFAVGDINHASIQNVGTNSHSDIDSHIGDSTIHFTSASLGLKSGAFVVSGAYDLSGSAQDVQDNLDLHTGDSTIHFVVSAINHTAIQNIGVKTHTEIDTHISNNGIHTPVSAYSGFSNDGYLLQTNGTSANWEASKGIYNTGFETMTTGGTLIWTSATSTFTLSGSNYIVWLSGKRNSYSTQNLVMNNLTSGTLYFIYINESGILASGTSFPNLYAQAIVATHYWDGTKAHICEERHGINWPVGSHIWAHQYIKARINNGFGATFTTTGFNITTGVLADEDLEFNYGTLTDNTIWYRNNTSFMVGDRGQTVAYKAVAGALQYNNGNALTPVSNNNYVAMWVYISNDKDYPVYTILGQRQDGIIANARANNTPDALSLGALLPSNEMKLLYRVIFRNAAGTPTYIETADYRNQSTVGGVTTSLSHGSLAGLANNDHLQYLTGTSGDGLTYSNQAVELVLSAINHTQLSAVGTNTHSQIDSHISNSTIHYAMSAIPTDYINLMGTGLISGGQIVKASNTTFNISAGKAIFADLYSSPTPSYTLVTWADKLNISGIYISTADVTYIWLDSTGDVLQRTSDATETERRTYVPLGYIGHPARTSISYVIVQPKISYDVSNQLTDFANLFGAFNVYGNTFYASSGLKINRTAGEVFKMGLNYGTNRQSPNAKEFTAVTNQTFFYLNRNGSGSWTYTFSTQINPNNFDNNTSAVSAVDAGKWTTQPIYMFAETGSVQIQYGQVQYASLDEAKLHLTDMDVSPSVDQALIRGWLCVQQGTTELSATAKALFIPAGKFGAITEVGNIGGGESNTASNKGLAGLGLFLQKLGVDLEFKNIDAGSSKISITENHTNHTIEIDLVTSAVDHTGLLNIGTNSHDQIDNHIADNSKHLSISGTQVLTVGPDEPSSPSIGDLWIDTN